jgi:protein involved in polysaccharide export with SLBB domain
MRTRRGRIIILVALLMSRVVPSGLSQTTGSTEAAAQQGGASSIVATTNSMDVLDDRRQLRMGDRLSYRVIEERKPLVTLVVTDSGEVEVPLIGRISASGRTCRELAYQIKAPLEREYFYKATVIIGLDAAGQRSQGKVYVTGQVKSQGAVEIPPGENFTVSKAVLSAGGLADFANKRKVRLTRAGGSGAETVIVDLVEVIDRGRADKDPVVHPDDKIFVPERLVNF